MTLELKKISPIELRAAGLDEKWLQERIREDTSLLGLGELEIIGREHRQPYGGRIDFLLHHAETETFYEVEIMLGALDESHIIRTIEYWDVERQRRPQAEHRAVIVAEQITSRFFNVLRLLNRAVPMIAVQLSAFKLDENNIVLHAVTVLDIIEEIGDVDVSDQAEQADRTYWEKKSEPASLAVMDKIVAALQAKGIQPRLTYNKYHIALRSSGKNFCWFHPRKTAGFCHIEFRLNNDLRDARLAELQAKGIDPFPRRSDLITFGITLAGLSDRLDVLLDNLKVAEELSRQ
jgi:hypothetical protein